MHPYSEPDADPNLLQIAMNSNPICTGFGCVLFVTHCIPQRNVVIHASSLSKIPDRGYVGIELQIGSDSDPDPCILLYNSENICNSRFRNGRCDLFGRFSGFLRESGELSSRSIVTISQVRHLKNNTPVLLYSMIWWWDCYR
jgi:hypothetical protein